MKVMRTLFIAALLAFAAWIFYWALFAPKEDVSQRIYKTLKEQEKRADLSFKKVSFEEVSAGEKFWQLVADTAVVNKNAGIATLQNTNGTFYKNGRAVLKFRSPAALWDMKKKEIYLDKPLGYDALYERQILSLLKTLRARPQSVFTLPREYKKGLGYWFQARNLSWKLADELLLCTGGIVLNKGEITGYADSLKGDVEFNRVVMDGSPRVILAPRNAAPVTLEADAFEISSPQDLLSARGNPVITWKEAKVRSDSARYLQREKKIELAGSVRVNYRDILASGSAANYFVDREEVVLTGNARATQGENNLSSDNVMVSLKDQKISLLGKSKVVITEEEK